MDRKKQQAGMTNSFLKLDHFEGTINKVTASRDDNGWVVLP